MDTLEEKEAKRIFFDEVASFRLPKKYIYAVRERMKEEEKQTTTNREFNDFKRKNIRTKPSKANTKHSRGVL